MFGKLIYYDREKINDYTAILIGEQTSKVDEYEISNDKGINANMKLLGADSSTIKKYKVKI